jgi:N-acetylglutamate synthase-like GNAT family acetyltransferase
MTVISVNHPSQESTLKLVECSKAYPVMGDLNLNTDAKQTFAIVIREKGKVVGGAVAIINLDWAYIDTLWIDASFRGRGAGKRLMMAVESYVHSLRLNGIYLYTVDFQAPEFYRKIGYKVMGTLPNHPQGHIATYYSKTDLATGALTEDFYVENPATEETSIYLGSSLDRGAEDVAPVISYQRLFVLQDDDGLQGGLYANEFWGWLEVHLCYATSTDGLTQVFGKVEAFCDEHDVGIIVPTYDESHAKFLLNRGYQHWSTLSDRPSGTQCIFWIRRPSNA